VISQSRYINIVSGVGAGAAVAQRQLILRLITQNTTLPPGIIIQFSNASSVGAYFGMASEEYMRALAYFSFMSKSITSPQMISFARWVNTAIAPMIVGDSTTNAASNALARFQAVTAGTLTINDGATPVLITALDFSTDTTLTEVAATLQAALRMSADSQLAMCTVTFNTNTNQFVLTGSVTGSGSLSATPTGLSTDVSGMLGWTTGGTVLVAGQMASTPAEAVALSAGISNNFGSFAYCTPATPLMNTDIASIAEWNDAQNEMYMYSFATPLANLALVYPLVQGYSGCAINILSTTQANDYVEQSPCEILAATNYANVNAVNNYMYYQFPSRNITVSDDTTANTVDTYRGNYIGQTESAGQSLAFYQRGVLCGGPTAATDMSTYANEMWLKSAISAQILSLFLNVPNIPANVTGQGMILAILMPIITQALSNGSIQVGNIISAVDKVYIGQVTGSATAWQQIQNIGYWLSITFSSYVNPNSNLTEWEANYTLLYAKNNAVRVVNGTDVMI
jgi:hypothetical protein